MGATLWELATASSTQTWKTEGGNRLVKVCSPSGAQMVEHYKSVLGYVTQEKYLYGQTCTQIERLLGLRPFELRDLCMVYSLARLPRPGEFAFKLTTAFPDGEAFGDDHFAQMQTARQNFAESRDLYERSMTPVAQYYPPGSEMIPQWKLTTAIPVGGLIATVTKTIPFPRDNGSIKPYAPHNRKPVS